MFQLADTQGSSQGLYCGPEGLFIGPVPLIDRRGGGYRLRPEDEITALLAAAYDPAPDLSALLPGLRAAAAFLEAGDLGRAMISAVLLGLGELSDAAITRLEEADAPLKANFNPAELRNEIGWWARDTAAAAILSPARAGGPARRKPRNPRAWENSPNANFRNRLAIAESSADKPDFGYGEVNQRSGALGRYQMLHAGLRAAA